MIVSFYTIILEIVVIVRLLNCLWLLNGYWTGSDFVYMYIYYLCSFELPSHYLMTSLETTSGRQLMIWRIDYHNICIPSRRDRKKYSFMSSILLKHWSKGNVFHNIRRNILDKILSNWPKACNTRRHTRGSCIYCSKL